MFVSVFSRQVGPGGWLGGEPETAAMVIRERRSLKCWLQMAGVEGGGGE